MSSRNFGFITPFIFSLFYATVCCLFIMLLFSCKKKTSNPEQIESNQLMITVQPTFGSDHLELDQKFTTNEGYTIRFTDLRFYMTMLNNGAGKPLTQAVLFDYGSKGNLLFKGVGAPTDFSSLLGYIGVDKSLNHNDPASFPSANPLSTSIANDMHWDWNPGYIFVRIEARVDTIADGVDKFDHTVVFHVGSNELIQDFKFENLNWMQTKPALYALALKWDLQKFLHNGNQSIDVKTEHTSHTLPNQQALSMKVMQNFKDALTLL